MLFKKLTTLIIPEKISLLLTNNCHYSALIEKDKNSQFIPMVVPEETNSSKKSIKKWIWKGSWGIYSV